jgi:hypothetical protein
MYNVSSLTLQDTQEVSDLLFGGPIVMDGRSVKLTMKHDPRRGSIEHRRFDLVGVGPLVATTRTSRLDLQGRQMRFKVSLCGLQVASRCFDFLSGRLDIPAEVLT